MSKLTLEDLNIKPEPKKESKVTVTNKLLKTVIKLKKELKRKDQLIEQLKEKLGNKEKEDIFDEFDTEEIIKALGKISIVGKEEEIFDDFDIDPKGVEGMPIGAKEEIIKALESMRGVTMEEKMSRLESGGEILAEMVKGWKGKD